MRISVIIPTRNEAGGIAHLIQTIREMASSDLIEEVLVVDADSADGTAKAASAEGASVLAAPVEGRAAQMNHGAEHAKGDLLYFLHADSHPPPKFDQAIVKAVATGATGGCFRMRFNSTHPLLVFSAWFTRFNALICRGGDQSLFVKKEAFNQFGGFPTIPIMEDIRIIKMIKSKGRFTILPSHVITSARKYQANGFFRLQFLFSLIHLGHGLGFSPHSLRAFYDRHIR